MHAYISTVTYLKRATLKSILGVFSSSDINSSDQSVVDRSGDDSAEGGNRCISESEFNFNLPTWKDLIEKNIKTADDIIEHLRTNGLNLSDAQVADLEKVNAESKN